MCNCVYVIIIFRQSIYRASLAELTLEFLENYHIRGEKKIVHQTLVGDSIQKKNKTKSLNICPKGLPKIIYFVCFVISDVMQ